jgi:four helix bundle protein
MEGMNDPEVTMTDALTNTRLIAHEKALEAAGDAITLVMRVPAPLKSIADQVIRSASSVAANLAEGHGRSGRDRLYHWRIAYASAKEVDSHMRLLAQAGAISRTKAKRTLSTFDEVRAMTWRLLNRKD